MAERKVILYYAWSRPAEIGAPLEVIDNRFPALFESRRMLYPRLAEFSDAAQFDQSVAGFLDHIMKQNFAAFAALAGAEEIERVNDDGEVAGLDSLRLESADTLIVVSFDSQRTSQTPEAAEIAAVRAFLSQPDHLVCICPHHDIGAAEGLDDAARLARQTAEFLHHGDKTIPPEQRFGGFGRALLAGLGLQVENRFGLHPAPHADGSAIAVDAARDRLQLFAGVEALNLHPHLPHFAAIGDAADKLEVLVRQTVDPSAPPHPFASEGRSTFDAVLQTKPGVFPGSLIVGDATLWSSTAGGVDHLRRLWSNVLARPRRA